MSGTDLGYAAPRLSEPDALVLAIGILVRPYADAVLSGTRSSILTFDYDATRGTCTMTSVLLLHGSHPPYPPMHLLRDPVRYWVRLGGHRSTLSLPGVRYCDSLTHYALFGTEICSAGIVLRGVRYCDSVCYAPATREIAYGAPRCPVLRAYAATRRSRTWCAQARTIAR
eukprot:1243111-Rhodomonas_salina.2